jgi:putative methionine-R-sulfoxide reductase with GAF domain
MHGSAQPEDSFPAAGTDDAIAGTDQPPAVSAMSDKSNGNRTLAEAELDSALQLLMERAQYITGATGAALALPQGEEMVCRASAGSSAPAVGVRLQVRSGLTGESISRRQLLRCDNAETDPRVNLEACQALGIASIVVLPLLRRTGEVRGLFELFSDHPYAFEERDLIALERMADLTSTALDMAEQREKSTPVPVAPREAEKPIEAPKMASAEHGAEHAVEHASVIPRRPELATPAAFPTEPRAVLTPAFAAEVESLPLVSVPEAMLRVQKCATCGFPVSEGRTLCLDCEKKEIQKKDFDKKQRERETINVAEQKAEQNIEQQKIAQQIIEPSDLEDPSSGSTSATEAEFVPAFLANAAPVNESWLANHVNLLAIVVLILGIVVTVVVFR